MKSTAIMEAKEGSRMTKEELIEAIKRTPARSQWDRAVREDAINLVNEMDPEAVESARDANELEKRMLNGAKDWKQYSNGGLALIYDSDIAKRYSTPSELAITKGGVRNPNRMENWIDVQGRALGQAANIVKNTFNDASAKMAESGFERGLKRGFGGK